MPLPRRAFVRGLTALPLAALVAGCGFKLRGSGGALLPYNTFHIALPENSEVGIWLRRYIEGSGSTKLVANAKDAEGVFQQLYDNRQKAILSLNAQGLVREYRLEMRYGFRIINNKGQELVPANEVTLSRDITFNDSSVLAKDQEEAFLWRDLNNDLVNQILRRLSMTKPRDPNQVDD